MTATLTRPTPAAPAPTRPGSSLTGTWRLARLALRRDRVLLPSWLVGLGAVGGAALSTVLGLHETAAERAAAAAFAADNPITRTFNGPAAGPDPGALALTESFTMLAVVTALLAITVVVRHTRGDEEAGRAELVGAGPVGRHARLAAALGVAAAASVAAGTVLTLLLLASGLAVSGSLLAGAALAGVGAVFGALAALTSQLVVTARAATGTAVAGLGVAFLLRAVGDTAGRLGADGMHVVSAWPSWLSPVGWAQQARAFQDERWWVLLLFVGLTAVLVTAATRASSRRDLGAGLLPARRGPARAGPRLTGPVGLAWRLQRGVLIGWLLAGQVVAASFGGVGERVDELLADNPQLADVLAGVSAGATATDAFFAFTLALVGVVAGAFTVQVVLRMRAEEATGRLEPVLATATSRRAWMASHLAIAAGGTVLVLGSIGLALGASYVGATGGEVADAARLVGAALAHVPAALALGGFVVAVFGLVSRLAPVVGWAGVALSFVVAQLGAALELPQALRNLSPFDHVPALPAADLEVLPLLLLTLVAVLLTAVGTAAFARRDLATGG